MSNQQSNKNPASPQDQIGRYVYEVTRRLPAKQRNDIEEELRSLIEDMAADRFGDREITLDDVNVVLLELGRPTELADKYREKKQSLIGPEYYDMYFLILKIVLAAVTLGLTIAFILEAVALQPSNIPIFLAQIIHSILSGLFQAFAWVTIIFAVISHYADPNKLARHPSNATEKNVVWNPADLPPIPVKNARIPKSESIVGIIFSVLAIILFNLFPQIIGVIISADTSTEIIPLFDMNAFGNFLPLFNFIFIIGLVKEVLKLFEGRYTLRLSFGLFILGIISIVITILIFSNPSLWNPQLFADIAKTFDAEMLSSVDFERIGTIAYRCFIGIVIFGFCVETITNFYKSIRYANK
jgi:hypothetical protein